MIHENPARCLRSSTPHPRRRDSHKGSAPPPENSTGITPDSFETRVVSWRCTPARRNIRLDTSNIGYVGLRHETIQ